MNLADLFKSIYESPIGTAVRESSTLFPTLESLHVLAIAIVVGTIGMIDLRLLGFPAHRKGARQLIVELLPFTWIAFVLAVLTGGMLFTSHAIAYPANPFFLAKMSTLLFAGLNMAIFHFGAYRRIGDWDDDAAPPSAARIAGALSLGAWIVIIFLGRWVGFTLAPDFM